MGNKAVKLKVTTGWFTDDLLCRMVSLKSKWWFGKVRTLNIIVKLSVNLLLIWKWGLQLLILSEEGLWIAFYSLSTFNTRCNIFILSVVVFKNWWFGGSLWLRWWQSCVLVLSKSTFELVLMFCYFIQIIV
jgi:hypothetical protein